MRSSDPAFLATENQELPWNREAVFTKLLMCEVAKPEFYKIDLFHTVTLGIGKSFAASCLAILQELNNGSSIELRMQELTASYLEFCRDSRLHFGFVFFSYINATFSFYCFP